MRSSCVVGSAVVFHWSLIMLTQLWRVYARIAQSVASIGACRTARSSIHLIQPNTRHMHRVATLIKSHWLMSSAHVLSSWRSCRRFTSSGCRTTGPRSGVSTSAASLTPLLGLTRHASQLTSVQYMIIRRLPHAVLRAASSLEYGCLCGHLLQGGGRKARRVL